MVNIDAAMEAVHHACLAGDFDAAAAVLYKYVYHGPDAVVIRQLGKYEAAFETLQEFFPFRSTSFDPRVTDHSARRWLLHETAACCHVLGRLSEAVEVGSRAVVAALAANEEHAAAISLHNFAETHLAAGSMGACEDAARQALALARRVGQAEDELVACTLLGNALDLRDRADGAERMFSRALQIAAGSTPFPILYSLSGVRYAFHLRRTGRTSDAVAAARANADFCRRHRWMSDLALAVSQVAIWGDMSPRERVRASDEAVRIARTAGHHQVLSEVLLEHARLLIESSQVTEAHPLLDEARDLALESGYQSLVCRSRLALAQVRLAGQDFDGCEAEIALAEQLCDGLGLALYKTEANALRQEADLVRQSYLSPPSSSPPGVAESRPKPVSE